MASNSKGKKRLCLDLSRCVNQVIKAPKFRIESTLAALQVIEKDNYLFSFDLKSGYLQVNVNGVMGLGSKMRMVRRDFFNTRIYLSG